MPTEDEIRRFVQENKEMIEELMELEKSSIRRFAIEERKIAKQAVEETKRVAKDGADKAEETAKGIYKAIMDPEVQAHFVNMGLEFFMGMSTLLSKVPVPECVKDVESNIRAGINSALTGDDDEDDDDYEEPPRKETTPQPKKVSVKVGDSVDRRDVKVDVFKPTESE